MQKSKKQEPIVRILEEDDDNDDDDYAARQSISMPLRSHSGHHSITKENNDSFDDGTT